MNEREIKYIPDSEHISTKENLRGLSKNNTYILYCRGGNRSLETTRYMLKNGFESVYNLKGGTRAWEKAELPSH